MACPIGYDPGIWSLAEYFQAVAEGYNEGVPSLPILYLQLKDRLDKSKIREHDDWVYICQLMIKKFWDDCVDINQVAYSTNQFVHLNMFNDLLDYVLINRETAWLLAHGKREKLPGFDKIPVPQPKRGHVRKFYG